VGCWLCPNSPARIVFLNHVYLPEMAKAWRQQLFAFAQEVGVVESEIEKYIDELYWTYRQGGAGLAASEDVVVRSLGCTAEENAKVYKLKRAASAEFCTLFAPFGKIKPGRKLLDEKLICDQGGKPMLSVQPFQSGEYAHAVKVKTLGDKGHVALQRKVVYQIRKHNACRNCGACDAICAFGAIAITDGVYQIDEVKCKRCKKCVNPKFMAGGCLMKRVLKTKQEAA
jgi:phosphoadenosine phosphosulfate reductase